MSLPWIALQHMQTLQTNVTPLCRSVDSIEVLLNMYHCEVSLLGMMLGIVVTGYQNAQCHVS
jgi:hypothetical protein